MEIWKTAVWHDVEFLVSNEGKVKRETNNRCKILKPFMNGSRAKVRFYVNGHAQYAPIAILVATAFLPRKDGQDYVEHIDGDNTNNHVDNLKWSDISNKQAWRMAMSKGQLKGSNEYHYEGDYAYVKISNADITMICDKDIWEKYKQYTWFQHEGYACARVNTKISKMHRLVIECPDGYVVDHINRNTFDNRRCNLRITTQCVNTINRGASPLSGTGVKGVYKDRYGYKADISVKKKRIYLGFFKTLEDAAKARAEAERKYHDLIIAEETLR